MESLKQTLERLLKDMLSLPEQGMRLVLLKSRLAGLEPRDIAYLLDLLYKKEGAGAGARRLKSALVDPETLAGVLGKEKYKLTYLASIDLELERVSRLFTDLPPHRTGPFGYDKEEEVGMEHTTLGERRALAKRGAKDTLDRLLSDPDPMVITNLLNNPRLTEKEVLKIASKRPGSPKILKLLATHRKWSKRYPVMRAIVMNPYTPPRLSTGLLEFLLRQDVARVARDKTLHPQVRMSAKELVIDDDGKDEDA